MRNDDQGWIVPEWYHVEGQGNGMLIQQQRIDHFFRGTFPPSYSLRLLNHASQVMQRKALSYQKPGETVLVVIRFGEWRRLEFCILVRASSWHARYDRVRYIKRGMLHLRATVVRQMTTSIR